LGSAVVLEEKWPVLGRHERAAEWLRIWTDLGRAPRTIDAYARGLAEYLLVCERDGIDPITAKRLHVAAFVKELATRPSRRGGNVVVLDSGAGLANATLQQRLCRCGCSTTTSSRRVCESPTRLVEAATRPAGSSADTNEGWYLG
jgi:hypothetical protein